MTPPVSVLHISSGDLWAGAEVQLFTLACALEAHTNTIVNIVLFNHGELEKKLKSKGFNVTVLDETQLNGFHLLKKLITVIHKIKPDVIHTHRTKENIIGSIAAVFCDNTPSIRTSHGASEFKLAWHQIAKHLIQTLDGLCARILQKKIIAVSADLSRILAKSFSKKKIEVIENGVDIETLQKQLDQTANAQRRASTIKIGIAGRLSHIKRVDLFIEAAVTTIQQHPKLKASFHIYGSGPLRPELENATKRLNAEQAIHFEGHCDTMHQALANLDILVISSDHEGLPMILLEAMALRVPVIAHAVGGIPHVLDNGNCGILVHQHEANAYANAFHTLAKTPDMRKRLSNQAHDRVTKHYSSQSNAIAYHAIYQTLKS